MTRVNKLIKTLTKGPDYERWQAAEDLGKLGHPKGVDPLIKALDETEDFVRANAVAALGLLGEKRAVGAVVKALEDENGRVRSRAAEALGRLTHTGSLEPLIKALGDPKTSVRRHAATSLGRLGDIRAVDPLVEALDDSHKSVQKKAALALGELGDTIVLRLLTGKGFEDGARKLSFKLLAEAASTTRRVRGQLDALAGRDGRLTAEDLAALDRDAADLARARLVAEIAGDEQLLALIAATVEELIKLHPKVQIVVEGDYVSGSKTTVRDSVVSRSRVGGDEGGG